MISVSDGWCLNRQATLSLRFTRGPQWRGTEMRSCVKEVSKASSASLVGSLGVRHAARSLGECQGKVVKSSGSEEKTRWILGRNSARNKCFNTQKTKVWSVARVSEQEVFSHPLFLSFTVFFISHPTGKGKLKGGWKQARPERKRQVRDSHFHFTTKWPHCQEYLRERLSRYNSNHAFLYQ